MHGYLALVVPVLRGDDAAGALLLEWLDPRRSLKEEDVRAVPAAGRWLRRLALPVPAEWLARPVPGLRQWALDLAAELPRLWSVTGRPFPRRRLNAAVEVATALAPRAVGLLANRDMHYQNVLAGEREHWLVIDPKVIRGDAEFGLAPLLWRRLGEAGGPAGLRRRFDALVGEAGFDAELARGWTLLRAVDYWLWACAMASPKIPHSARPSLTGSRSPTGRDAPADASSTYRQAAGTPVQEAAAQSRALLAWL